MEFNRFGSSMPFGGLSRQEILRGAANRLLYSKFYTYYYGIMLLLGLISLGTALIETCPSIFFIVIESIMCICMMLEIITRALAMHWSFLTTWWNYFDIIIVMFCGITLILLSGDCSPGSNSEELLNTVMIVVRNGAQVFRLLATLRKNRRQMDARGMNVDLDDGAAVLGFIDDMDGFDVDHTGYRVAGGAQADGDTDFRLSIDSTGDYTEFRNSDGRSSANSVYSTPERLTARRSIPPLNGPPPPSSIE